MDEGVKVTTSDWGGQTGEVGTRPELVQKALGASGKGLDTSQKGVRILQDKEGQTGGAKRVQR